MILSTRELLKVFAIRIAFEGLLSIEELSKFFWIKKNILKVLYLMS